MSNIWEKIKQGWRSFMSGRHGIDQLSMALVWAGLILYVLDILLGTGILMLLGLVAYILSIYRALSRNQERRTEENVRYVQWMNGLKVKWNQMRARFANRKEYKYFRCPQCRTWIRLPRGTGDVTVTCRTCGNKFNQKA